MNLNFFKFFHCVLICTAFCFRVSGQSCVEPSVSGTTYITIADGNWDVPATWQGGVVPGFNIGSNNKVVINHVVDRNTLNDFKPSAGSILVIKNGGSLTTEQIQMESSAQIIINYGRLHVDHGNFQVMTSAASVCAYQACIRVNESFQFGLSGTNMTFNYTGIEVDNGNLQSNANVSGDDIRIWLKNGNLERNGGTWPSGTISYRRVSGSIVGFSGITGQSSASAIQSEISPCLNAPLPLNLVHFNAVHENGKVHLSWITASGQHYTGFTIERSADAVNWQTIGYVAGSAEEGSSGKYMFEDAQPVKGLAYYRLKQTDYAGNSFYSNTQALRLSAPGSIRLFPNPARETVHISGLAETGYIRMYGPGGRLVRNIPVNAASVTLSLEGIAPGIYNVVVTGAGGTQTGKLAVTE